MTSKNIGYMFWSKNWVTPSRIFNANNFGYSWILNLQVWMTNISCRKKTKINCLWPILFTFSYPKNLFIRCMNEEPTPRARWSEYFHTYSWLGDYSSLTYAGELLSWPDRDSRLPHDAYWIKYSVLIVREI